MKSQVLSGNLAIGCRCFLCYDIIRETKEKSIDFCGFFPTNSETLYSASRRENMEQTIQKLAFFKAISLFLDTERISEGIPFTTKIHSTGRKDICIIYTFIC